MDQETREEFAKVHAKLGQHDDKFERIDQRFDRIDAKFERIDEKFERIDEKFERIDEKFERIDEKFERIDSEFRMVHGSFNQVFKNLHYIQLTMEELDRKFDKACDSSIDRAVVADRLKSMDAKVDQHEVRIGALEAIARKS